MAANLLCDDRIQGLLSITARNDWLALELFLALCQLFGTCLGNGVVRALLAVCLLFSDGGESLLLLGCEQALLFEPRQPLLFRIEVVQGEVRRAADAELSFERDKLLSVGQGDHGRDGADHDQAGQDDVFDVTIATTS